LRPRPQNKNPANSHSMREHRGRKLVGAPFMAPCVPSCPGREGRDESRPYKSLANVLKKKLSLM